MVTSEPISSCEQSASRGRSSSTSAVDDRAGGRFMRRYPLLIAAVAFALAGCGGMPAATVTVTETATKTAGAPTPNQQSSDSANEVGSAPEPDIVVVADMVGQNYQDAQDVWRASGLIVIPAEDATGANRLPFIDSNWYVVGQTPVGGTEVAPGGSIQAKVKKYTDD